LFSLVYSFGLAIFKEALNKSSAGDMTAMVEGID
jgi:hypothetical protein